MRRWVLTFLGVLVFALIVTGCGEKPIAEVNGDTLTRKEFDIRVDQACIYSEQMGVSFEGEQGQELLNQLKQNVVNQWIDEKLVMQAGEKEGVTAGVDEIEAFLEERIKKGFQKDEEYQDWLKKQQMTEDDLKRMIKYQLTGQGLFEKVTSRVTIDDETAQKQFEQDKENWEKVKVSHILVEARKGQASEEELTNAKEKAKTIVGELDEGADFAKLAQKYSDDPGTKDLGGILDMEFNRSTLALVPEFVSGAFQLNKVGEYTREPILTDYGYHIIKLDVKKSSFEEVKEDVKNYLAQGEKNIAFQEFIEGFRDDSEITNNLFAGNNEEKGQNGQGKN